MFRKTRHSKTNRRTFLTLFAFSEAGCTFICPKVCWLIWTVDGREGWPTVRLSGIRATAPMATEQIRAVPFFFFFLSRRSSGKKPLTCNDPNEGRQYFKINRVFVFRFLVVVDSDPGGISGWERSRRPFYRQSLSSSTVHGHASQQKRHSCSIVVFRRDF